MFACEDARRGRRTFLRPDVTAAVLLIVATLVLAGVAPRLAREAWGDRGELPEALTRQHAGTKHFDPGNELVPEIMRGLPDGAPDSIFSRFAADSAEASSRARAEGHDLGWRLFAESRNVGEAYRQCDESQDAGCYHGVLQLYFAETPRIAADDIATFCNGGTVDATVTPLGQYHCLHGLGHGLAIAASYLLSSPLASCDLLAADRDREWCYSGVFMEMTTMGRARASGLGAGDAFFELDAFPRCETLLDRYQSSCFVLHPLALLIGNGADVPSVFASCERVPLAHAAACYKGLGMAITGVAGLDPAGTSELCALGTGPFRVWCWSGAIESFLGSPRTADRALSLCQYAPGEIQVFCFETIGETLLMAVADPVQREAACAKAVEATWIAVCRSQAGLL